MEDEDLSEREDMVVTITSGGYIKRTPLADFRAQRRGGKGLAGMQTKDEDVVTTLFVANTHTQLLFSPLMEWLTSLRLGGYHSVPALPKEKQLLTFYQYKQAFL